MKRVLVIGHPGAGKSTLARHLAARTGLPLIHLDRAFWQPGWVETPHERWVRKTDELISRDAWVMDGSYTKTLKQRLARADTVIYLKFSRYLCLWRIVKRVVTNFGRVRADLGYGCPERLDFVFLKWAWHYRRDQYPVVEQLLQKYFCGGKLVELRNPREVHGFLEQMN
ncbi:AAA family ATPase [candidate division GN15 bacterium]|nr:AAA family ATPase [candidate division GN15 bacterium]